MTRLLRITALTAALLGALISRAANDDALFESTVGQYAYSGAPDDRYVLKGSILIDAQRNFQHRADLVGAGTAYMSGFVKWATLEKPQKDAVPGEEIVELEVDVRTIRGPVPKFPRIYRALMKDGVILSVWYYDKSAKYRAYSRVQPGK